jgi:serine/threonine protein kinase
MAGKRLQEEQRHLGKYALMEKRGSGGSGAVYKARDTDTGELVAIKVLKPEMAADRRLLKRFEQEFLAARALDSAHIVRALDFGQDENVPYLVMEYVEGQDLWEVLEAREPLPEGEALLIIAQVAQALDQAHELGIIHRDVKPDNILLLPDGRAKLADFGLIKDLGSELNLTDRTDVLGTPNFMAPEQFHDPTKVDRRCDVYSLAATLYMVVTRELPFAASNYLATIQKKLRNELVPPRQIAPKLSERVERAILGALHLDPAMRPATCGQFMQQLTGLCATPTPPITFAAKPPASPARERRGAVRYPASLKSYCRPIGGQWRTRWKSQVKDISATGMGLEVSRRFERGAVLALELLDCHKTVISQLLLLVVRVQRQASGRWLVGGQWACPLRDEEVQHLQAATNGAAVPARGRRPKRPQVMHFAVDERESG